MPPGSALEIAGHWLKSGSGPGFGRWAMPAAAEAEHDGNHELQATLLDELLAVWEQPGVPEGCGASWAKVVVAAAHAHRLNGDSSAAAGRLRAILEGPGQAEPVDDLDRVAALVELAGTLTEMADPSAATAVGTAIAAVRELPDTPDAARMLAHATGALRNYAREEDAAAAAADAARSATRWGLDDVAARCETTVGALLAVAKPREANAAFERGRTAAARLEEDEPVLLLRYYINCADALRVQGQAEAAASLASTGLTWAVKRGFTESSGAHLAATLAEALIDEGRLSEAMALVLEWVPRATANRELWWLTAIRGRLELAAGSTEAAGGLLAEVLDAIAPELLPVSPAVTVGLLRCGLCSRSRAPDAVVQLSTATAQALAGAAPVAALELLALAASHSGSRVTAPVAWRRIDNQLSALTVRVHPDVSGPWLALVRAYDSVAGSAQAAPNWDAAVTATKRGVPSEWRVRSLLGAAQEAAEAGRIARARTFAAAAAEALPTTGVAAWKADVERLQATLLPAPVADWEVLSSRELEVLHLLAGGISNEGVAIALGISHRTAEVHVGRVMHKLGASSRGEAVAAAIRRGLLNEDDLRSTP